MSVTTPTASQLAPPSMLYIHVPLALSRRGDRDAGHRVVDVGDVVEAARGRGQVDQRGDERAGADAGRAGVLVDRRDHRRRTVVERRRMLVKPRSSVLLVSLPASEVTAKTSG